MADVDDRSRLLLQNKSRIVRELDVIKVLPRLVQKRAFTIAEERQILSKSDNAGRAEALIDLLTQKPAGAFDEFNNCLKTTYPKLRQLLLVSAYVSPIEGVENMIDSRRMAYLEQLEIRPKNMNDWDYLHLFDRLQLITSSVLLSVSLIAADLELNQSGMTFLGTTLRGMYFSGGAEVLHLQPLIDITQ
ncbi:hypothetical protein LSH36_457g04010 [Paralvinella palmiformis]|uniref:CARD domain-containing protein n=1 Tax=Paralvinella palmiformis TaxID=53620 RepID=A0AAD9MZC2_9ANNE|nr:hypothetical protein LSH36_457g04010 [Paralvinella palmiformis]